MASPSVEVVEGLIHIIMSNDLNVAEIDSCETELELYRYVQSQLDKQVATGYGKVLWLGGSTYDESVRQMTHVYLNRAQIGDNPKFSMTDFWRTFVVARWNDIRSGEYEGYVHEGAEDVGEAVGEVVEDLNPVKPKSFIVPILIIGAVGLLIYLFTRSRTQNAALDWYMSPETQSALIRETGGAAQELARNTDFTISQSQNMDLKADVKADLADIAGLAAMI